MGRISSASNVYLSFLNDGDGLNVAKIYSIRPIFMECLLLRQHQHRHHSAIRNFNSRIHRDFATRNGNEHTDCDSAIPQLQHPYSPRLRFLQRRRIRQPRPTSTNGDEYANRDSTSRNRDEYAATHLHANGDEYATRADSNRTSGDDGDPKRSDDHDQQWIALRQREADHVSKYGIEWRGANRERINNRVGCGETTRESARGIASRLPRQTLATARVTRFPFPI